MVSLLLWGKKQKHHQLGKCSQLLDELHQYLSFVEQNICHINPIEHHLGQFGSCQTCNSGENIQGTGHFMSDTYGRAAEKKRCVFILE